MTPTPLISMKTETVIGPPSTVTALALLGVVAAVMLVAFAYRMSDDGLIPVLDHANLAFHEAGHVVFGIFGPTIGLYGGTLGQLVFPMVIAAFFARKGAAVSAALGLLWLFQNFLNIARYLTDARAQQLPLVGGGEHDWFIILSNWGVLSADTRLARALTGFAWMGMVATAFWIGSLWYRARLKAIERSKNANKRTTPTSDR